MQNEKMIELLEKLKRLVEAAMATFNAEESYLIANDLSERCVCARFAMHLQRQVSESIEHCEYREYVVDVEYNRGAKGKDYEPKRLYDDNSPITVDLIVHKRGYSEGIREFGGVYFTGYDNLICIEMKKSKDKASMGADKRRLEIMTNNSMGFAYKLGVMIIIDKKSISLIIDEVFYNH